MNCPKCSAELKEGAKFCHVCGFNVVADSVNPQPQSQPQIQGQIFDLSKTPVKDWIFAGVAFFGVICTFLPWLTISMGYWGSVSANGLNSIFGVLTLLCYLAVTVFVILWRVIGITEQIKDKILLFTSIGAGGFCIIDLIRFIAQSEGYARPGFGLILAILVAVALVLIKLKVIKLK